MWLSGIPEGKHSRWVYEEGESKAASEKISAPVRNVCTTYRLPAEVLIDTRLRPEGHSLYLTAPDVFPPRGPAAVVVVTPRLRAGGSSGEAGDGGRRWACPPAIPNVPAPALLDTMLVFPSGIALK